MKRKKEAKKKTWEKVLPSIFSAFPLFSLIFPSFSPGFSSIFPSPESQSGGRLKRPNREALTAARGLFPRFFPCFVRLREPNMEALSRGRWLGFCDGSLP